MKTKLLILSIASALIGFIACKKQPVIETTEVLSQTPSLPDKPYDYANKHHVNSDVATLGRVLFYDKNMSVNNTTYCGSCHKQQYAFADNVRFNRGFNGVDLGRNSPSIQGIRGFRDNAIFHFPSPFHNDSSSSGTTIDATACIPTQDNQIAQPLFWDGRQTNVADMVLNPVLNHKEMSMPDFDVMIKKLSALPYYKPLFKKAYGDENITKERVAFAMEGFMACLNTGDLTISDNTNNTNQDPMAGMITLPGVSFPVPSTLTPLQQDGLVLFHVKYNCGQCHKPFNVATVGNAPTEGGYGGVNPPTRSINSPFIGNFQSFNSPAFANIGLDDVPKDKGLGALSRLPGDAGMFKIPTLHNISLTAPYMHDGRYATLSDVLDHYSHNIKNSPTLSPVFKNTDGSVKTLNISPAEKTALIAFLNTLTDNDFITSPMYADPFK
jgi:cytochrome c peroxidase